MNTSVPSCSVVWNLTPFLFKTWHAKYWNATFLHFHAPKSWQCTIQDLASQVLKLFGVNKFNIRSMPRMMSFMTWSSKTWTQVKLLVQQSEILHLFCSRLGMPSFEMLLFCDSMPPSLDNSLFKTWLSKSWNIGVTPWIFVWWACSCLRCFNNFWLFDVCCLGIWKCYSMSFHVIPCHFMSFHDCLRSAPHATLAGRRLLHFIVWVFSLAFLMFMFMFNDCGPDSCDHKRHRECVAMAFQHRACWGQDLLWPELLQCGKKARESHLSTCVILANIHAGIQSRHQVVLHVKVFFPFMSCLAEW